MYKKENMDVGHLTKAIIALVIALVASLTEHVWAETTAQLSLKPKRCVAMNEGQTCYQTVTVNWQAQRLADYCLYQQDRLQPIVCWQQVSSGKAKLDFAAQGNVTYKLMLSAPPQEPIVKAQADMVVTWVYSKTKKRKNSWRLF